MINASLEFKNIVNGQGNKNYLGKAEITLVDNTVLTIENPDIWDGGIQIVGQSSNSGSFDIGFCACNQLAFKIKNMDGKYSSYNLQDAVIRPYIGLELSAATELVKRGVFTVDLPEQVGSYINLTCMDNMYKLDKKVTSLTGTTAGTLVNNICIACGVSLKTASFDGYNRQLKVPSDIQNYTYRQALSYICQAIGTFARFDQDGLLEIKWYDTGAFESSDNLNGGIFDETQEPLYQTGDTANGGDFACMESTSYTGGAFTDMDRYHHVYSLSSLTVATDDVVITGVKVINDSSSYLSGSTGYVLNVENNPFTLGKEQEIANYLGARINGMTFRPLSVSAISNPLIEEGDPVYVTDRKGTTYQCYATGVNFTIRQNTQITCDAESPQVNSSDLATSSQASIEARRIAQQEITAYNLAVQQLNNLLAHSFGVYKTEEVQEDGSVIYYMHDEPTLEESMTIWKQTSDAFAVSTDGGQNWNAGFDASGNVILNRLDAIGINADWINSGTIDAINITGSNITGSNITGTSIDNGNGTFIVDSNGLLDAKNIVIRDKLYMYATDYGASETAEVLDTNWYQNGSFIFKNLNVGYGCSRITMKNPTFFNNAINMQNNVIFGTTVSQFGIPMIDFSSNSLAYFGSTNSTVGVSSCFTGNNTRLICNNGTMATDKDNIEFKVYDTTNGYNIFRNLADDKCYLGHANYRWKTIYSSSGAISTSDRNLKENITYDMSTHEAIFNELRPTPYKMINGDRTHIGFVSQDIEEILLKLGLTAMDFAGFCKDTVYEQDEEASDIIDKPIGERYGLRYEEFIALNTHMIQRSISRISTLENENSELKERVSKLELLVNQLIEKVGV